MSVKPMTTKQRYWLKHVTVADTYEGTLSDYAGEQSLQLKALYGWKTKLIRLGLYQPARAASSTGFVAVQSASPERSSHDGCTLTLSNGTRIEFAGVLDNKAIRAIITSAGLKR